MCRVIKLRKLKETLYIQDVQNNSYTAKKEKEKRKECVE